MRKLLFGLFLLPLMCTIYAHAQMPDLPILHDSLYSDILKEGRPLEIVLPPNYNPSAPEKYDVLYVTDGEWNTRIVSNIRQFLGIQFIPDNIIVSIPNVYPNKMNQRGRDFTPTHTDGMPESGGAPNFLAFIKTELLPYINKKYKTNGQNTFYGSSLGGLFAMYVFCKEPELFQSYLIADPAWWWDNHYTSKLLKENLGKLLPLNKTLLITGREGAAYQYMGIAKVDSIIDAAKKSGAHWKTMLYNDETHNSMIFRTVYDGLKYTYAGYMKEDFVFHPMNGLVLKDKPVTLHLNDTEFLTDMRFTTDGTTPVSASQKIAGDTLQINGATQLTIKSLSNREQYSKTVKGKFAAITAALPAIAKGKNMQPGGLTYSYYEGVWDSLPDFKKLKPLQSGIAAKDFDFRKLPKQNNFACMLEGQLEIKTDGYYIFGIDVAGGAKFFIGNQLLIDYNGIHSRDHFQSVVVPMVKGFYPVRIEYFNKEGAASINTVYITPDNNQPGPIPVELLYGALKK